MTPEEKYLFDLNGYLVVDDILSPDELALANQGVEKHSHLIKTREESLAQGSPALVGERGRGELSGLQEWAEPWGRLFRDILTHPRLVPYFHELLGKGFRLDHPMFLLTMDKGTEGFHFHGAAGPVWDSAEFYVHHNGGLHCGLTVAAIQLTDVNPGDGGFAIVPGSHKANFTAPQDLLHFRRLQENIRPIACRAGSAVIFTEALTHGTLPWRSDRPRRTLLTRYNRATMAYVPAGPAPAWATEREQVLMQPPGHWRTGHKQLPD